MLSRLLSSYDKSRLSSVQLFVVEMPQLICYSLKDLFRSDNSSESTVRGTSFKIRKFLISDQRSFVPVLFVEQILVEIISWHFNHTAIKGWTCNFIYLKVHDKDCNNFIPFKKSDWERNDRPYPKK